jgi:prepilin-type N-terminal cleavage/methylation domain-containing protein
MENRALVPQIRRRSKGFSLLEVLITLATISTVAAMAYVGATDTTSAARSVKLMQDVAALNRAVKTYASSGGDLSSMTTASQAIARLKTMASATSRAQIAGLRGAMIDPRLQGIASSGNGTPRAVWNNTTKSFVVQDTGSGFQEFQLDNSLATTPAVEEERSRLVSMNSEDKWIWKFNEGVGPARTPRIAAVSAPAPVVTPGAPASLSVLQSPVFELPGGLYDFSRFVPQLPVPLRNRNDSQVSEVFYSINNGPWQRYDGNPMAIPRALTTDVRAYSAPLDPDRYEMSAVTSSRYETIFFGGNSAGVFSSPAGDSGLVTNLVGLVKNAWFEWGSPALDLGYTVPNSLSFTGRSFTEIAPEERFALGTLTYYNGSTYTGTNATSVQLEVTLDFSSPAAVERLPFTFNLLSTRNTKAERIMDNRNEEAERRMDDDDADYVYIPDVSTRFNTTIKGRTFYLVLSFGSSSDNGFTTINEFHTHENKTMTGTIFGRFTTKPPSGSGDDDDDDD